MQTRITWIIIVLLTACSPRLFPNPTPYPTSQEFATLERIDAIKTIMPEKIPPTRVATYIAGEVPAEFLNSIFNDLADRTGVTLGQISIVQAQAFVWNDGSLGCPQPGKTYTQAPVIGYWVILEVDRQKFDYRASDKGYFFLCENGIHPIAPPNTPSS